MKTPFPCFGGSIFREIDEIIQITINFKVMKNGIADLGMKSPLYLPGPVEPHYGPGRYLTFEGFSVDQHGKQVCIPSPLSPLPIIFLYLSFPLPSLPPSSSIPIISKHLSDGRTHANDIKTALHGRNSCLPTNHPPRDRIPPSFRVF